MVYKAAMDTITNGQIMLGSTATELETYAARELQRCLYQLSGELLPIVADDARLDKASFVVGRPENNKLLQELLIQGTLTVSAVDPGEQGYVLKKLTYNEKKVVVITGSDKEGVLYGTYGLLDDYFGVGFYFSGDVFPDEKQPIKLGIVDERKTPKQYIRGVLPWSNFPQSSTSYSFEDYKYFFDQMAKMRFNLLHLHNYWGYWGYNEIFHNITCKGVTPRLMNATAATGHVWGGKPGWDVNQYRFGTKDLFGDYDFGTDATLHNEGLSNIEVTLKGVNLFKRVIEYAHSRGVKVALGLEIDTAPEELGVAADDSVLMDARIDQLIKDYPHLDYLLCYRNETFEGEEQKILWHKNLDRIYERFKAGASQTRIGVSGWGLDGAAVEDLQEDIICAPIARYGPTMESGSIYGQREYWGCPWVENDGEVPYFNPSGKWGRLSATVIAYKIHDANMRGFTTLTWRLTDAMDPKLSYIAKAPWDLDQKYKTSFNLYHEYAVKNYGQRAADLLADILDKGDPGIQGFGECMHTPEFKGADMTKEIKMVDSLLTTVAEALLVTTGKGELERIKKLRSRLLRFKSYCQLEQSGGNDVNAWRTFAREMAWSVDDISSLGGNVSLQNRFVQLRLPVAVTDGTSPLNIPLVKVISPPVSGYADEPLELVARVMDNDPYDAISATIHYRVPGESSFQSMKMSRRTKAIFATRIPGADIDHAGLEYYVSVTDGSNAGYWPVTAPESSMSYTVLDQPKEKPPSAPLSLKLSGDYLSWQGSGDHVSFYRIYRAKSKYEPVSRATYLTYVDKGTLRFSDKANDFEGRKLEGEYWYRVTAVDDFGRESRASEALVIDYTRCCSTY